MSKTDLIFVQFFEGVDVPTNVEGGPKIDIGNAELSLVECLDFYSGSPSPDTARYLEVQNVGDLISLDAAGRCTSGSLSAAFPEGTDQVALLVRAPESARLSADLFSLGFSISGRIRSGKRLCAANLIASFDLQATQEHSVPSVILIGRANVNLLAQVRALGRCNIPVYCILTRGEHPIVLRSSRYCRGVLDGREAADARIVEMIHDLANRSEGKPVVFTGGDLDIALLGRIAQDIEPYCEIATAPLVASGLNDKQRQLELMESIGIRVPKSLVVANLVEYDQAEHGLEYPVIMKPLELAKKGKFQGKVYIAEDEHNLKQRLVSSLSNHGASVLVQEFIPGGIDNIYFALAACSADGTVEHIVTGRKLRDNTKGGMGVGRTVFDENLQSLTRRAFKAFGVGGVLGIEFKYDSKKEEFVFIEANFRPENIHAICEASLVNIQLYNYCQKVGLSHVYFPLEQRRTLWMDFSLIALQYVKDKISRKRYSKHGDRSKKTEVVDGLWTKDDLRPAIFWYLLKAYSLGKRMISKLSPESLRSFG